jgi:hypothetical protein
MGMVAKRRRQEAEGGGERGGAGAQIDTMAPSSRPENSMKKLCVGISDIPPRRAKVFN